MLLQQGHDRIQDVNHRHVQPLACRLQIGAQRLIHHGRKHGSGLGLDAFQHTMQLKTGPDQAPAMVQDLDVLELRGGGSRDRVQGFAGRVRDEMEVDPIGVHRSEDNGDNGGPHREP